jgi:predicted ATPase
LTFPTILLGWCQVRAGQVEDGIARISNGLADYRAQGLECFRSYYQGLLAEACGKSGQVDKGLELLADALAFLEKTGEDLFEAELHRFHGELLLMRDDAEDLAEASFRKAIQIARRQQAKSWELRATTSLSRLLQKQGKTDEARRMLS